MNYIRIGIVDEEEVYVKRLAAYLNQMGKGKWRLAAFTGENALQEYLKQYSLDIVMATELAVLQRIKNTYGNLSLLWLTEHEHLRESAGIQCVFRYQAASGIGAYINRIASGIKKERELSRPFVAIYSPVGRCGKTTLALTVINNSSYGRWLYIGMEDYSSFPVDCYGEDFLFFLKERQQDKMLDLIQNSEGKICSAQSVLDKRSLSMEDFVWLRAVFQQSGYGGIIFDVGTGILWDYSVFQYFDYVIVPYIRQERALVKKQNFEMLLEAYDIRGIDERIIYMDMDNNEEVTSTMDAIFDKGWMWKC